MTFSASLGNSDQARVTVMRNGQQQDITLNMSQIATQAEQISTGSADQSATGTAAVGAECRATARPACCRNRRRAAAPRDGH